MTAMRMDSLVGRLVWIVCVIPLLITPLARAQEVPGEVPREPAPGLVNSSQNFSRPASVQPPLLNPAATAAPFTAASQQVSDLARRENLPAALQVVILLTVLSLAPALLIMMTSFTRIIIVLSLLRQALGTAQLPPNQVLIGLALFMTFLIMAPTWDNVNNKALKPYMEGSLTQSEALDRMQLPIRDFMITQIELRGNEQAVYMFSEAAHRPPPEKWQDVSTLTLVPSFMLGELRTAFYLGFKVYLPFLIVDMVISSTLISMGMMMLPPAMISLPFKLLLFVMVDGWRLITGQVLVSFTK